MSQTRVIKLVVESLTANGVMEGAGVARAAAPAHRLALVARVTASRSSR